MSEQPSIFELYETEIGPLTPVIAEILIEAVEEYPHEDIVAAFREAAERNVRNWRYIDAILQRWQMEGRSERVQEHGGGTVGDRRAYFGVERDPERRDSDPGGNLRLPDL